MFVTGLKGEKPDEAIKAFESIVDKEEEQGEWCVSIASSPLYALTAMLTTHRGFKSLKQLTKLTFRLKRYEASLKYYSKLLPYTKKAVTRKSVYKHD